MLALKSNSINYNVCRSNLCYFLCYIDSCKKLECVFLIFPSHVFYNMPLHYIATGLLQLSLQKMMFFSIYLCSFMTSYPILGGKNPKKIQTTDQKTTKNKSTRNPLKILFLKNPVFVQSALHFRLPQLLTLASNTILSSYLVRAGLRFGKYIEIIFKLPVFNDDPRVSWNKKDSKGVVILCRKILFKKSCTVLLIRLSM